MLGTLRFFTTRRWNQRTLLEAMNYTREFTKTVVGACCRNNRLNVLEDGYQAKDLHLVFVDAGCFDDGFLVLGCVIKDINNKVVLYACTKIVSNAGPMMAEAMTLRWGIEFAEDLGL